jgi:hypothetical protein
MRLAFRLLASAFLVVGLLAGTAGATHNADQHSPNMSLLFQSPNATGAVNSDLAFWRNRAYAGNYDGFRIFDISDPASPTLLSEFPCFGPQNDPIVWKNRLLFLSVDEVLTGPECGSEPAENPEDPSGWEGVRIFDVSDPTDPEFITGVYTDCGAHTITLWPRSRHTGLIYVSSYSLTVGPTCGPNTGEDPLHGKISVIRFNDRHPELARVIAQPRISYPGDPDNQFDPAEHGFDIPGVIFPFRACHDIGVVVKLRLAGAACGEQAQLWRVKRNGIPDAEHPLWVYDDNVDENGATSDPADQEVAVDFWHSATFSWDGKVVNFIDESFGNGCPPVTAIGRGATEPNSDTGRMFFLDTATGTKLSHFMLPRPESVIETDPETGEEFETAYCSAHLGNAVRTRDAYLLVNAWYMGGVDVIDFTDPTNPEEVAFYDLAPLGFEGSFLWSAYWYEGPRLPGKALTVYGNDIGHGFQVFRTDLDVRDLRLTGLNPQTQVRALD